MLKHELPEQEGQTARPNSDPEEKIRSAEQGARAEQGKFVGEARAGFRDRLQSWSAIVANFSIAITLGIALVTYLNQIETQVRSDSLTYVRNFNDGPILEARNKLYAVWSEIELPDVPREYLTSKLLRELYIRQLAELSEERAFEMKIAVINIADYIDGAATCLRENLCDERIIRDQLGQYAHDFFCIYDADVSQEAQRLNNSRFGSGLRELAASEGQC